MNNEEIIDLIIVGDLLNRSMRVYGHNCFLDSAKNIIERYIKKVENEKEESFF